MRNAEYRKVSGTILKKHYGESIFVVMIFLTVYLLLKVFDVAQIVILLYNNGIETNKLFISNNFFELLIKIVSAFIGFILLTPLITGGLWWFYQTACGNDNMDIIKLYTCFRLNLRAAVLYGIMWIISMISIIPSVICIISSKYVFDSAYRFPDQGLVVFLSLQLFMAGIFLIGLYLKCFTSMILSPFIFIDHPDMSIFKILNKSRKIIYGAKLECLGLLLTYIPAMLPLITIPFILPKMIMTISAFAVDKIGGADWEE